MIQYKKPTQKRSPRMSMGVEKEKKGRKLRKAKKGRGEETKAYQGTGE